MINDASQALQLDREDPLAGFRQRFRIPFHNGKEQTYFLGNSLGLQPVTTAAYIDEVLSNWSALGVEAFFEGNAPWLNVHDEVAQKLTDLIGCGLHEISIMNQLTVNLHLMLVSFYQPLGKKNKILCEQHAFPSDQYMLHSHVEAMGLNPNDVIIEMRPQTGTNVINEVDILNVIEQHHQELALILLPGIQYYTGQIFNLHKITSKAHEYGILCGFDLAHAIGNIPLSLHDWDVDFACWCSYKYLNGGPGAVSGVFIHEKFHDKKDLKRFAGWWGNDKHTRFLMEKKFIPEKGAQGWQLSTPSPILFACLNASLDLIIEAGWNNMVEKQKKMHAYHWSLIDALKKTDTKNIIQIITPRYDQGCQISLFANQNGKKIHQTLKSRGFITDWREPNVIRLAPVPLYNRYIELYECYHLLQELVTTI